VLTEKNWQLKTKTFTFGLLDFWKKEGSLENKISMYNINFILKIVLNQRLEMNKFLKL